MHIIAPTLGDNRQSQQLTEIMVKMTRTVVFPKLCDPNLEYQNLLFLI